MEGFRTFTYWFMAINFVASTIFTFIAIILGGKDLLHLIRDLKAYVVDDTDDGRAITEEGS